MHAVATAVLLASAMGVAQACSVVTGVHVTFYGWADNDPAGDGVAYNCGGRNFHAGGTGTYANPLTFASAPGEYSECEIVYSPYLKKYLRMEDSCHDCTTDWSSGVKHIDIWTGNPPNSCELALTPDGSQSVVRAPPSNLPVNSTPLWDGSKCRTDTTSPGAAGSCSTPSNPTCQTGCSWVGHCIGCPCQTYDDCSDNYVCTNGACASA